jgi:hypothetical protein
MNELAGPNGQNAIKSIVNQIDITTTIGNTIYALFREKCYDELKKMVIEKRGERTIINPINIRSSNKNETDKNKTVYVNMQGLYEEIIEKYKNVKGLEYSEEIASALKEPLTV